MMRTFAKAAVLASLITAAASTVSAHDFWLMAKPWNAPAGETVTLTANVGEDYPTPDSYVQPARVEWVRLVGPDAKAVDVSTTFSRDGEALATPVTLPHAPGLYVAMTRLTPRFIELQPQEFTAYLKDEGLERIVEARSRLGETGKPGRERYSRWPKALIRAGDGGNAQVPAPLNLTAEFVPSVDPSRATVGDTVAFRLLFEGKPVPDATVRSVVAGSGKVETRTERQQTDADGLVRFQIRSAEPHFIAAVHMVRRSGESGAEAVDWESYWVSLTFKPMD